MRYIKNIEAKVYIENPLEFVATNYDQNLLALIKHLYEGKSIMGGCFVIQVLRVISKPLFPVISATMLNASSTFNIIYEAEVEQIASGEIIACCKIETVTKEQSFLCKKGNNAIAVRGNEKTTALRAGMLVCVYASACLYDIGKNKICINASINIYPNYGAMPVYSVKKKDITAEESSVITILQEKLAAVDSAIDAAKSPRREFFANLLNLDNPAATSRQVAIDGSAIATGYYINASIARGMLAKLDDVADKTKVQNISMGSLIIMVLSEKLTYSNALLEMITTFTSEKMIKEHDVLWRIYDVLRGVAVAD